MGCSSRCKTEKAIKSCTNGVLADIEEYIRRGEICRYCCNKNKDTLLIISAKYGHNHLIGPFLKCFEGGYIEQFNKTGKRALHEAVQYTKFETTSLLLQHGADVNALKQADWTALMLAAEKKCAQITKLLISNGADISLRNKDGWTAFHVAARAGSVDILEILLQHDPTLINTCSKNGRSPLHSAALNNCHAAALFLLEAGISPEVTDSCGITPLMDGARMGNLQICETLIRFGGSVLSVDNTGRSLLHHTAQAGQGTLMRWCVDKAQQVLKSKPSEDTPHFIDWQSKQGSTALHYAAKENKVEEIKILKELGANTKIPDSFGRLPSMMTNNDDIQSLLEQTGQSIVLI